jgi:hypothetical protein
MTGRPPLRAAVPRLLVRLAVLLWLALGAGAASAGSYTVTATRDTWINEASTAQNNGTLTTIRATASSTGTSRTRSLIGFTMPVIPSNEVITSAVLQLRVTTAGAQVVNVHNVTAAWVETTATWANMAVNFNATVQASFTPSTVNTFVSPNITALVQGWNNGTITNNGVMLLGANSSLAQFASKENGTVANRPQLIITTALIQPAFTMVKSSALLSDPYNNAVNPKAIPGAVTTYTVNVSNSTAGTADTGTTIVRDAVPATMILYVGDVGAVGSGPVAFTNGALTSGLVYIYTSLASITDSLSFSNNGGTTFVYTPVPDANGYDAAVTNFRVNPTGIFAGKTGATAPSFQIQLRMKVK